MIWGCAGDALVMLLECARDVLRAFWMTFNDRKKENIPQHLSEIANIGNGRKDQ